MVEFADLFAQTALVEGADLFEQYDRVFGQAEAAFGYLDVRGQLAWSSGW